ncbi:hypothetical protein AN189_09670 [Loktanella sp. 3ANDIMAR09]|uniref:GntR family transcriptional regulator n=1 Tax=Loktanella sp. 3ANDIMAR09 TaxID=1225657 RepID=UPI0006F33915|nr:GntR family transcriptional regulator [Loktanella sp. 3ANDIMAR09]KQI68566.1 hypothetical protein AN189_09670 [Loktanella sp. 3ANDIMAR09]
MAKTLPKYIAVSERLIRQITAGHLADGTRLPGEREMARDLGLSVGTLRKALAVLADKGLLDRVQGSGNYVRHRADVTSIYSFFRLERPEGGGFPSARVLDVGRNPRPSFAPRGWTHPQAWRIRRLRLLDDLPAALEEIWIDGCHALGVRDLSESLYRAYSARLGLTITRIADRIGMGQVPDWAPVDFALSPGTPCCLVWREGWEQSATPMEVSRTWFDHDKARYVSRAGKG